MVYYYTDSYILEYDEDNLDIEEDDTVLDHDDPLNNLELKVIRFI